MSSQVQWPDGQGGLSGWVTINRIRALLDSRATAPVQDRARPYILIMKGRLTSMVRDFDDNAFPLAYFISFRTYGTWLHGDERFSVNRKQNKYGTPRIAPNARLQWAERKLLKHPPVTLDAYQRPVVEKAIREVCEHRGYELLAINVRTNHVHTVVSAQLKPEPILQAFQAYATRNCAELDCYLAKSSRGPGMGAHRTCGRKNTWRERLTMYSMDKVTSYLALMTEEVVWSVDRGAVARLSRTARHLVPATDTGLP